MLLGRLGFVVLPLTAMGVCLGAACEESAAPREVRMDASAPQRALGDGICPAVPPDEQAPCLLPESTTCAFGGCLLRVVRCMRGLWTYAETRPPPPACPAAVPDPESACPPCWPENFVCTYATSPCPSPDAGADATTDADVGVVTASCSAQGADQPGRWALRDTGCGIHDAGADVQRDAEADAD